jgi:hypothetical protein
MRLLLQQPSPVWRTFHVEEISVMRDVPRRLHRLHTSTTPTTPTASTSSTARSESQQSGVASGTEQPQTSSTPEVVSIFYNWHSMVHSPQYKISEI